MCATGKASSEETAPNSLTRVRNRPSVRVGVRSGGDCDGVGGVVASARLGAHVVDMQRRRLLLAFVAVVAEVGIEGASVGRVCGRAGVSRRTFYEIFNDREACFLAAFETAVEHLAEHVIPAYEGEHNWGDRVRAALTALLERFDSEPGLARLCVVETLRAGAAVSQARKRVLDVLTAAIDEGRHEAKKSEKLPPLTAEGVVGGALSVLHTRLLRGDHRLLGELQGPLMGMIIHPYLGAAAARRELERRAPDAPARLRDPTDPFKGLAIRFTYRTALVLSTIASDPGASNRHIATTSGIADDGQMSRLLRRLRHAGLIENHGNGQPKGEANAWRLTERGEAVHAVLGVNADVA
jgi:AcrR family transcriptional regulator